MILVNKPFFPPKAEFYAYMDIIWQNEWLTNSGPLVRELERELEEYLHIPNALFVANGTLALQLAIKTLGLKGEIITTPFSFVATTSSIVWEGCKPVFVDIDKETLNIDPMKIEAAITDKTSCILATHVYGNPCDVMAIQAIADKYNLKVIYDGAHAFGVNLKDKSIFEHGDISVCSTHATKWFHTVQGGFLATRDLNLHHRLQLVKSHGISDVYSFAELGTNGRNCELHAAMGLVNLKYLDTIHNKRKELCELYDTLLADLPCSFPKWNPNANRNYSYYPIILESEEVLIELVGHLFQNNVATRRYFYPSLASSLPYVSHSHLEIAEDISKRVLCLPLYYDLKKKEVKKICEHINQILC